MRLSASHGFSEAYREYISRFTIEPGRNTLAGRVLLESRPVHIPDVLADPEHTWKESIKRGDFRTMLGVPLLREGSPIGVIAMTRSTVNPFTEKQIELLRTFADQAVIAIENVRLFEAEQQRTRELSESLEQQTATSDVLRVISSSPGELEPVFQAMLENTTRICEAKHGNLWLTKDGGFQLAATHGLPPEYQDQVRRNVVLYPGPKLPIARAASTRELVHILDLCKDPSYVEREPIATVGVERGQVRTMVAVPMLKDRDVVGVFAIARQEVRPFTEKQIELVQNFAAQAVIAIENTRLLNELRQSLEQQTATSEVLGVISSSPNELGPVFQTILANATRLCEANFGTLNLYKDGTFPVAAMHGVPEAYAEFRRLNPQFRVVDRHPLARVAATGQVQQIFDMQLEPLYLEKDPSFVAMVESAGARTLFLVPMLKDNDVIGIITIFRQEVRPFTDKQIELVQNFAAQAVIAIENTRLLNELRQSLEQQTATSDVLRVISSSPGELEPVFQAMLENATRICEAKFGTLFLCDGEHFPRSRLHDAPPAMPNSARRTGD